MNKISINKKVLNKNVLFSAITFNDANYDFLVFSSNKINDIITSLTRF